MEARRLSNQAVDAREADPRLKSAKTRRVRLRSLATRTACGFLTVATLLTLPLQAHAQTLVDRDWRLIPTGLGTGDQFRLIFLSSTKRNATSDNIADYNTFVQNRAAAGHSDIQAYSSGFRVVGCTAETDARDNTATTGTGVAIHWLNGNKVADDYPDFYDGDWDDEANNKDEDGDDGRDTSTAGNHPRTGCEHNGTEATFGSSSRALGSDSARVGIPNSSVSSYGPLSSATNPPPADTRPMYGLSQIFEVGVTDSGRPAVPAPPSIGATEGSNTSLDVGWLEPANAGPDVNYDLRYQGNGEDWTTGPQNVTAKFANVTGLSAGASYEVQVRASNNNGDSNWSPSGTGQTNSGNAPGAPSNLTATANGQDRINLNWTAPSYEGGTIPSNPGEPDNEMEDDRIRSYKIEVRSAASNWLVLDRTSGSTDTVYSHRDVPAGVLRVADREFASDSRLPSTPRCCGRRRHRRDSACACARRRQGAALRSAPASRG